MKRIICFGEVLWDLFPNGRELGGAPANFAYRAASLGCRAELVSRVGADALGKEAIARLRESGLETHNVQVDPALPTGTVEISLSPKGEPDFEIIPRVAYDQIEFTEDLRQLAGNADCIYFGTLAQRSSRSRETLQKLLEAAPSSAIRLLDINLRKQCYTAQTIQDSLLQATMLKLNESEVVILAKILGLPERADEFAGEIVKTSGLTHCLVTRGERGVYARSRTGEECAVSGISVDTVDTCGAGDAFTAGFITEFLSGAGLVRSCRFGNALGALVAGTKGATSPISRGKVEELLLSQPA